MVQFKLEPTHNHAGWLDQGLAGLKNQHPRLRQSLGEVGHEGRDSGLQTIPVLRAAATPYIQYSYRVAGGHLNGLGPLNHRLAETQPGSDPHATASDVKMDAQSNVAGHEPGE